MKKRHRREPPSIPSEPSVSAPEPGYSLDDIIKEFGGWSKSSPEPKTDESSCPKPDRPWPDRVQQNQKFPGAQVPDAASSKQKLDMPLFQEKSIRGENSPPYQDEYDEDEYAPMEPFSSGTAD